MHRLRCLVVIGVLAVAVCVAAAGPAAAAKGGNNDTAKACQHGGWQTPPGVFANQGDCVNDGSQSVQGIPGCCFGTSGNRACREVGGFAFDLWPPDAPRQWSCMYLARTNADLPALVNACTSDSGVLRKVQIDFATWQATCYST